MNPTGTGDTVYSVLGGTNQVGGIQLEISAKVAFSKKYKIAAFDLLGNLQIFAANFPNLRLLQRFRHGLRQTL